MSLCKHTYAFTHSPIIAFRLVIKRFISVLSPLLATVRPQMALGKSNADVTCQLRAFQRICVLFLLRATCNGKLPVLVRPRQLSRWLTQINLSRKERNDQMFCTPAYAPARAPEQQRRALWLVFEMTSELSDTASILCHPAVYQKLEVCSAA